MTQVRQQRVRMGQILYLFAVWTLIIKFLLPIIYALRSSEQISAYIMWDAWWVAHFLIGFGLIRNIRRIYVGTLALALVEVCIIGIKFMLFLPDPAWTFRTASWFVNKTFMLAFFAYTLLWLSRPETRAELR